METYEKAIPFKNWTTEKFVGQFGQETLFDGEGNRFVKYHTYEFEPGGVYNVPASQAKLFARQLAVQQLHKQGTDKAAMLADLEVKALMDKCFPGNKPDADNMVGTFERLDAPKDSEAKSATSEADQNTFKERESDEDEDNADDEKNNAGQPKFKRPAGRPRKEEQYA